MWWWNESRRWDKTQTNVPRRLLLLPSLCLNHLAHLRHALTDPLPPPCLCARAADWKLDSPDWTGRMRLTARGKVAYVKLEDKISGERETVSQSDRGSVIVYCLVVNHATVSSSTPSLVLICSKVSQPVSKLSGYFEAQRLIIKIRLLFCLFSCVWKNIPSFQCGATPVGRFLGGHSRGCGSTFCDR